MNHLLKTCVIPLLLGFTPHANADESLPVDELAFIDTVPGLSKAKIVELLGDPGESITVTDKRSGKEIGTIWRYEYINTNADGDYYKSTELDMVGDRVVTVIFSNSGINRTDSVAASATECAPVC